MDTWLKSLRILLFFLFTITFVLFLTLNHLLAPSDTSVYTKADLGTFGDFFGGILNPLLSTLTILLLLWSLMAQLKELKISREQHGLAVDQYKITLDQLKSSHDREERIINTEMMTILLPKALKELHLHLDKLKKTQTKQVALYFEAPIDPVSVSSDNYKYRIRVIKCSYYQLMYQARYLFKSQAPYTYSIHSDLKVKEVLSLVQNHLHRAFYCIDEMQKLETPPFIYAEEARVLRRFVNQFSILAELTNTSYLLQRSEAHIRYIARNAHKVDDSVFI